MAAATPEGGKTVKSERSTFDEAVASFLFHRVHESPPVLVTQEHRAVLVAGWAARQAGLFGEDAPLLLRLDAHPDLGEPPRDWKVITEQLRSVDDALLAANAGREDDGGWVIAAMQWGLCGAVAACFVHEYHRFELDSRPYSDFQGIRHPLWTFASLRELSLCQRADLWAVLTSQTPIWLDLDLDFATRRNEDGNPSLWEEEDWRREFSNETLNFLLPLLPRVRLVTVCTEPGFCGGLPSVGAIAQRLKDAFRPIAPWFEAL